MGQRQHYHPTDFGERQWTRLLEFALVRADSLECAIPYPFVTQDLRSAPLFSPALEALREMVVDRHVSLIRWGRRQDYAVQFLRLRLDPPVRAFVRSMPRLEEWCWRDRMPEDPYFMRGESVLLSTESANGRISVYADEDELEMLRDAGIRLVEPLGVLAKPWPTP